MDLISKVRVEKQMKEEVKIQKIQKKRAKMEEEEKQRMEIGSKISRQITTRCGRITEKAKYFRQKTYVLRFVE